MMEGMRTDCVHAGVQSDETTGAVLTPIYQSTTFEQPSVERYLEKGYSYSRSGNPTVTALENKLKKLDNAKGGATCFSTGMAATYSVLAGFLKTGDHCIMTDCSYGGTNRCARVHFTKYDIKFDFVDFRDIKNIEACIKPYTKMIFSESPTNPILTLADVKAISDLAMKHRIIHVCDSTFATPLLMKPLDLGADIVIHSTTKFMDGHNITVGGVALTNCPEKDEIIKLQRNICGSIMSPQVAFYTLQTLKTLPLRFKAQSETAMFIASHLEKHPNVAKVTYPGLPSFPQQDLAKRQHLDDIQGTMLCFEVKGGVPAGKKLMNSIKKPWSLCENLGAAESIITYPAVFTHGNMLKEDREKVGITDGLIRVSVGLEDRKDLLESLLETLDNL